MAPFLLCFDLCVEHKSDAFHARSGASGSIMLYTLALLLLDALRV